jgi:hypothetical protein
MLGAMVLGIFTAGPIGVFAAPILALFGWFYLFPIAVFVSAGMAIAAHPVFQNRAGAGLFVLAGAMVGALFMAVFGVKEIGNVVRYTIAYAVGGGLSGGTVAGLIVWLRRMPERDRPTPPGQEGNRLRTVAGLPTGSRR